MVSLAEKKMKVWIPLSTRCRELSMVRKNKIAKTRVKTNMVQMVRRQLLKFLRFNSSSKLLMSRCGKSSMKSTLIKDDAMCRLTSNHFLMPTMTSREDSEPRQFKVLAGGGRDSEGTHGEDDNGSGIINYEEIAV